MHAKKLQKIVVLATGGTIAGWADDASKPHDYKAGQLEVADLLRRTGVTGVAVVTEQLAQLDSKDMDDAVWRLLLQRAAHWLAQADVQGLVITHGTDTLEETAYFLQAVLQPTKPVAITCAMRAANAPDADGPVNLSDALHFVADAPLGGVFLVCAGEVHAGHEVQKMHSHLLNPFSSGELGPVGLMHAAGFQALRAVTPLADAQAMPNTAHVLACDPWPSVEIVLNHAGAQGQLVRALMQTSPPDGWVVAGTGNGTLHHALRAALQDAQAQGAHVLRASRCALGGVQTRARDVFAHAGRLTAVQARVALRLQLMKEKGR